MKQFTEKQKHEIGEKWAGIFMLKRDKSHRDRYQTTYGNKTAIGIFNTLNYMVQEVNNNL